MEHPLAFNQDFNLSTNISTSVKELAETIWNKIHSDKPLKLVFDTPFEFDVQKRIPSTDKAKNLIGFEATTKLDEMLDEVIPWLRNAVKNGLI